MSEEIRKLNRRLDRMDAQIRRAGGTPQLASSSIEDGSVKEYDSEGGLSSSWGKQYDGTHTQVTLAGPKPPTPRSPALTMTPGSLEVRWSGKFVGLGVSPLDFKHVSVHLSRLMGFAADSSNQKATIRGELGDVATLLLPDSGTYYVKLVTWTLAGKSSDPSDEISITVDPTVDVTAIALAIAEMEADIVEAKADSALAQTAAAAATSKADTAKTTADNAASAAATASGIAAGKGKTLIQSTAPGAEDRNNVTLWIDTTLVNGVAGNIPKKWVSGTTWTAVTDKTATDAAAAAATAASAAATAKSRADEAFSNAGVAATAAGDAMTAANGKSANWYQDNAPAGNLHAEGDTWWDTNDSFKMYSWNATTKLWVAKPLGTNAFADLSITNAKIGAVDAGKVSTGYLDVANRVNADSISVEKILIGSNDNVIPDPMFTNNSLDWGAPSAYYSFPAGEGRGGKGSFKIGPNNLQSGRYSRLIPATGGESYRINVWVKSDVLIPAGALGIYRNQRNTGAGSNSSPINILKKADGVGVGNDAIPANTWTQLTAVTTLKTTLGVDLDISGFSLGFYTQTSMNPAGSVWWSEAQAFRMGDGKMVLDGDLEGRHIKSETMETRHFQADSVLMKHILVGDFSNMIADPIDNKGATTGWASGLIAETAGTPPGFVTAVKTTAGQGSYSIPSPLQFMDVDPGTDLLFSFWVKASKPNSRLYIEIRDQAGAHAATWRAVPAKANGGATGGYPFSTAILPTVWTQYWAQGKVNSTAKKVRLGTLYFNHTAGTEKTAVVYLSGLTMKRQMQGEIIVDGALDAKLITGAKIQTLGATNRGITLDGYTNKMQAWNASGVKTFELDGATGNLMAIGEYYSDVAGKPRVRISDSLYGSGYAGMTFETDGTASGLVAGIKTSLANDYWKGALFLTSATNPNNGYDTNMSEMRLASDRINYFVKGPDTSQKSLFEMDVTGYVATTVFANAGSINQEVRNSAGTLLSWSSQSTNLYQNRIFGTGGLYKSVFQVKPEDIMLSWAGVSSVDTYNPNAYFWMHNTGGVAKAEFNLGSGWLEAPRLRLTATNDVSETSTLHAFQIGSETGDHIRMDNNEIARITSGAFSKILMPGGLYTDADYTMTADTHMMTLGTYKAWIDPTILTTQSLDTIQTTGDYAQSLNTNATTARKYPTTLAGLLEVRNPSGAGMIYQRYTVYGGGQNMYTRALYSGTWTAWVEH